MIRSLMAVVCGVACLAAGGEAAGQGSQLSDLLNTDAASAFETANKPRRFSFPEDHGPHEAFRNEWWYITGNLDAGDGSRFGFELTIFRFSLTPDMPAEDSAWRSNQVYVGHLALTDADRKGFYMAERYSRGALGLAGAQADPFRVWIDDWQIAAQPGESTWRLVAADDAFAIDLNLLPLKQPVLNGEAGLSRKSHEIDSASYYYSIPRLQTSGSVTVAEKQFEVAGYSWLDREWSTSALATDQVGWDWFALQLSDGSELMLYNIRKLDGSADPSSSGTLTLPDGSYRVLRQSDFEITATDSWDSPKGGTYPARWTVSVPSIGLDVEVEPVLDDQELETIVRYWEGAVDVTGTKKAAAVSGRGYVELTGYAE